jgi:hypothetical protein
MFVRVTDRDFMLFDIYCEENGFTRAGLLRDLVRMVGQKEKAPEEKETVG